jgi:hypothetical protein
MEKRAQKIRRAALLCAAVFIGGLARGQVSATVPLVPSEAVQMASSNISRVLQWIEPSELRLYGFDRMDDFSAIQADMPVYQQSFTSASIENGSDPKLETRTILVPLRLNGTIRCFMYISPDEQKHWKVVGIGGRNEAVRWEGSLNAEGRSSREDHKLMVHVDQDGSDFIVTGTPVSRGPEQYVDVSMSKDGTVKDNNTYTLDQLYAATVLKAKEARKYSREDSN